MKTPNGTLIEEYITQSISYFECGELQFRNHDPSDGEYTGRFQFQFDSGKYTKWYTERSAPKWLLEYYKIHTTERED